MCIELFPSARKMCFWIILADVYRFVALFLGALKGVAVFFIGNNGGEFDTWHGSGFEFVNDGLEVGAIGRGDDDDAEGGGGHGSIVGRYYCFVYPS